jgi:hypothetical protein
MLCGASKGGTLAPRRPAFDQLDPDGPICLNSAARPMTDSDLQAIAEYRVEMVNPGMWSEMSDRQKVAAMRDVRLTITAQLMCGFIPRKAAIRNPVE